MPNRKALWRTNLDAWIATKVSRNDLGCLVWTAAVDRKGYPFPILDGKRLNLARYVLSKKLGRKVRSDRYACHHCDNPPCIEPGHLYEGTPKQNVRDAILRGRFQPNGNGLSLHPERAARGKNHGTHHYPEQYRGERNSQARLTEKEVLEIRAIYRGSSLSQHDIGQMYGVTRTCIEQIICRRTWKHLEAER